MTNEVLGQQKRRQLLQMLDRGLVMLHLDPREPGVSVPPQFAGEPVLRLNLAYGFNLPALDIDAQGVFAVLSFSGQNFGCTLPWDAIFAMTAPHDNHEGMVWAESVPQELAPYFQSLGVRRGAMPVSLRVERGVRAVEEEGEPGPGEAEAAPPPRPFQVHDGGRADDAGPRDPRDPTRPKLTVVGD
ncbi:MAG: stringent starvation protein B [Myxococcales bacterium]|nr:stringent starvation protein B [Myxococcales bacterium]MCB9731144.1 stringent starvation protein B [Deltaproteobacteria bacterium]